MIRVSQLWEMLTLRDVELEVVQGIMPQDTSLGAGMAGFYAGRSGTQRTVKR
jgi:hypothetical protein